MMKKLWYIHFLKNAIQSLKRDVSMYGYTEEPNTARSNSHEGSEIVKLTQMERGTKHRSKGVKLQLRKNE